MINHIENSSLKQCVLLIILSTYLSLKHGSISEFAIDIVQTLQVYGQQYEILQRKLGVGDRSFSAYLIVKNICVKARHSI